MKKKTIGVVFGLTVAALWPPAVPYAQSLRFQTEERPFQWEIWSGATKVLVYSFDPAKFKPYVKELRTIKGDNVLRDAPYDHLHHHALMYGIRVNGLNFWEETPGNGVQKPVQFFPPELATSPEGRPQARLRQMLHWVKPDDAFLPDTSKVALLVERRTLTLTINPAEREVALEWQSVLEVGQKTNQVSLSGANYHGLGVRFLQELDPLAAHVVSSRALDLSSNRQDVSQGDWAAVLFKLPERPATLAMVGGAGNLRGSPLFFSMKTPFAYLSATQGLDREPLLLKTGDNLTLRYLVLVYPEIKSAEALERRAKLWRE